MHNIIELDQIMDASIPLVVIETFEEKRVEDQLLNLVSQRASQLWRWSLTDGLARLSFGPQLASTQTQFNEPVELLRHIKSSTEARVFMLCDFHPYLQDQAEVIRLIKDIALNHLSVPHTLIFVSHRLSLPRELSRYAVRYSLALPDEDRIMEIVRDEARAWSRKNGNARLKTDSVTLKKLMVTLQGLSASDVRRLVRTAIWNDGAITETDLPLLNRSKFQLLDLEGVVNFEHKTGSFADVGGLDNLKRWLGHRREAFLNAALDRPKGILLLGVQGGGKSLAAKAVAGLWDVALLRLDMGALYNKFYGETERNMREALSLADAMSPCVLWLDELEKGMSQEGNDNGTSQRLLGTLLTWMAERNNRVFIVATSNDISRLPPELIRKGRLDEIFFVDLPDAEIRQEIFSIHLQRRDFNPDAFDLSALSEASEGFSGAEIEQTVVAACYQTQSVNADLQTEHILEECRATSPLSVVMAEQIQGLRRWASERTVPA